VWRIFLPGLAPSPLPWRGPQRLMPSKPMGLRLLLSPRSRAARRSSSRFGLLTATCSAFRSGPRSSRPITPSCSTHRGRGRRLRPNELAASEVPKLVAVSCNPGTLARDLRTLLDGGYRTTRVVPVDQFLGSVPLLAAYRGGHLPRLLAAQEALHVSRNDFGRGAMERFGEQGRAIGRLKIELDRVRACVSRLCHEISSWIDAASR
jgi:hypothetical protein